MPEMHFVPTLLSGAYIIEPEKHADERGFFARTWCQKAFLDQGLDSHIVQCNISFNPQKGTLRGMHLQLPPHTEAKLVRCTCGAIYDVIVDLRPQSETLLQWIAVELSAENRRALYVPEGFAHGFQTLVDDTEVFYQMSEFYAPECAFGLRWNDPQLNIEWPEPISLISERDNAYPDYSPEPLTPLALIKV
nr:dTDP-4-dehydrorhamnose 3,5-epimerase [Petrachloros mirabilis]